MKYIAHKREDDGELQTVKEHLTGTAELAREFASTFGCGDLGELSGLLHDIGKYSTDFQKRILDNGALCDHSTAGAREVSKDNPIGKLLAYCIAGHHGGLPDGGSESDQGMEGTLCARLCDKKIIPDYEAYLQDADLERINFLKKFIPDLKFLPEYKRNNKKVKREGFTLSFLIRMLYSCLVDADFLDTEKFMYAGKIKRGLNYSFQNMYDKLNAHLTNLINNSPETELNRKRKMILQKCLDKVDGEKGLYTLTVPTGGGKTLSSLAFALKHLLKHNFERIIYVIPYTSIIEQNAKIFADILGQENVLEHHANFDWDFVKNDEEIIYDIKKLATENWDMPVVVTTNCQFFESLFANKSSKCRKLHNITNSIIIFDEVQMFPLRYLTPCIEAITELIHMYGCTAVLCSATQPALEERFHPDLKITDIYEDHQELYSSLRRTEIKNEQQLSNSELLQRIAGYEQCLAIVNTRRQAQELFTAMGSEDSFHLSTLMCGMHRKNVLDEIKRRLKSKQTCRVVSTQLIEAGVDVDFPVVYRALAGLDSLVQSAGRCNREGNSALGTVHVFIPEDKYSKGYPADMKRPIEITKEIMNRYEDALTPEVIKNYFEELYFFSGEETLDAKKIFLRLNDLDEKCLIPFKAAANDFKLIEENTIGVIIPYDAKAVELISKLRNSELVKSILRSLQLYTVNIYETEFRALADNNKIELIKDKFAVLKSIEDYDLQKGLIIPEIERGIAVIH